MPGVGLVQVIMVLVLCGAAGAPQFIINTTELDCQMRRLIQIRVQLRHPHRDPRQTFDALQLDSLCGDRRPAAPPPTGGPHRVLPPDAVVVSPGQSIPRAVETARGRSSRTVVLTAGLHCLNQTLELGPAHAGISIIGSPPGAAWISGGQLLPASQPWRPSPEFDGTVWITELPEMAAVPGLFQLEPHRRYTRSRFPNADAETAQWGYASVNRDRYSLAAQAVTEWQKPAKGRVPEFSYIDLSAPGNPSGAVKNDSSMDEYNTYTSGRGGVCETVWEGDSYWCSNNSAGGWAEVDRHCAESGQLQIPVGLRYDPGFIQDGQKLAERTGRWGNISGALVHAWHSQSWATHVFEVDDFDPEAHSIGFSRGGQQGGRNWCRCDQCTYAGKFCTQHQVPPPKQPDTRLIGGSWYIEGVKAELDASGEYHFDSAARRLYFKPNGTNKPEGEFVIPVLQRLVEIRGSLGSPATNISIIGVGFRDAASTLMGPWGVPSGGDWSLSRSGAVFIENAEDVLIRNCTFRRLDGTGVFLSGYTNRVIIDNNEFAWLGMNAMATWGETNGYDAREAQHPQNTLVSNNWVHELGIYEKQSSAWGQAKTALTTLINNVMWNMPRAAINFNDHLGGGDVLDSNIIFNTCRESGDHGPINSWDRMPFLTHIRDGPDKPASFTPAPIEIRKCIVMGNYGASQAVDNDDGSSAFDIHHNVFYSAEGLKMDYGGHSSSFHSNLVIVTPYDGSNCINVGAFKRSLGHRYYNNTCVSGSSQYSEPSGCGSPACANASRPVPDMDRIGGAAQCQPEFFTTFNNRYFTPNGNASLGCGNEMLSIAAVQKRFNNEKGSRFGPLPSPEQILKWATAMLP